MPTILRMELIDFSIYSKSIYIIDCRHIIDILLYQINFKYTIHSQIVTNGSNILLLYLRSFFFF